jgi:hypothetical protein
MSSIPPKDRTRSPRAPRHSLGDAVSYARKIYEGVHRSPIDSNTAFQLMGFAGKSGTSATALGSLRQYGLIDGAGDRTRISELAMRILEPASETERMESASEAAHHPDVFRAIYDRFEGRVPAADEPLRAYLIREKGFSRSGADDCIKAFRETNADLQQAQMIAALTVPTRESAPSMASPTRKSASESEEQSREQAAINMGSEFIKLPLTRECSAELRFIGRVTDKAVAGLIKHIELLREIWAEDESTPGTT